MNTRIAFALAAVGAVLGLTVSASGNAPDNRYTVASGTVYDTKTKLTWQQVVPWTTYSWADAKTYCAGLSLAGTGWRLPTVKDESIVRSKCLSLDADRLVLVFVVVGRLVVPRVGYELQLRRHGLWQRGRPHLRALRALRATNPFKNLILVVPFPS